VGKIKNNDPDWRVIGLQGPKEAGFSSLLERLNRICERLSSEYSLLHAKKTIKSGLSFCQDILEGLKACARRKGASSSVERLQLALDEIEQSSDQPGSSRTKIGKTLARLLDPLTQERTLILLCQGFEEVREDRTIIRSFADEASTIPRLIVVFTAIDKGLDFLQGREEDHIRLHNPLPRLSDDDLYTWAHDICGHKHVTMKDLRDICGRYDVNGNPDTFQYILAGLDLGRPKNGHS
jgi:hypothetical protein